MSTESLKSPEAGNDADAVRAHVAEAYTAAIDRVSSRGGCCSPPPVGVAAQTAGYGDELSSVPEGAAASSFGCGNPLSVKGVLEGQTVLDLGSGAGLDLVLAAKRVGPTGRAIGVDMTDAMIDAATRHLEQAGVPWAEVRRGVIEDLPVDAGAVDWVISNCVINLSPQKEAVFAEIARVLSPGGQFSVSDIVAEDLPEEILGHAAAHAACVAGAISEADYVAGLEAAGLVDVEVFDRQVYDADQLRAMVASDLQDLGVEAPELEEAVARAAGRVASVRVTGRRP
ncbi:MAG: methyltransferase domain-containing protein [Acidobacteriota bacterium]